MNVDIGIEANKRQEIAGGPSRVLADSYTLYLKTHNFHWNVTGPRFETLYLMFEAHETVARTAREVFKAADGTSDQPTCDLLTQRMQVHEKTAWML